MTRRTPTLATLGLLAAAALAPAGCLVPVPVSPSSAPSADLGAGGLVLPTGNTPGGTPAAGGAKLVNNGAPTIAVNLGEGRSLTGFFRTDAGIAPTTGVVWTSNAEGVLTVNPTTGMAQALSKGTAIVTVALQNDPSVKAQITVNVADANGVQVIRLTPAQALLTAGEQQTLRAEVVLGTGEIKSNVVWSSSDDKIATVDANGQVTAKALGTVQILASFADDPVFKGQATVRVVLNKEAPNAGVTPAPTGTAAPKGDDPGTVAVKNQGTWVDQVSGVTEDLSAVAFADAKTGVAAGKGVWLTTSDGGATWNRRTGLAVLAEAERILLSGPADAWIVTKGAIHKTSDGVTGTKAIDFKAAYGHELADVVRVGGEGYALLANGALFRSTGAGTAWEFVSHPGAPAAPTPAPTATPAATPTPAAEPSTAPTPQPTASPAAFVVQAYNFQNVITWGPVAAAGDAIHVARAHDVTCRNPQTGGYYTCSTHTLYSRIGGTWLDSAPPSRLSALLFTNAREGWRVSYQSAPERSVDGGKSWIPVNYGLTSVPRNIGIPVAFLAKDADHVIVLTSGGYYATDDNGRTWTVTALENINLAAIAVVDEANRWAVGSGGKIKRYVVL